MTNKCPTQATATTLGYKLSTWTFPTNYQIIQLILCSGLQGFACMLSQTIFHLTVQSTNQSCPNLSLNLLLF